MYYLWLQHFLKRMFSPQNLITSEVIHFYVVYVYYVALFENLGFWGKFDPLLWKLDYHGYHGNYFLKILFLNKHSVYS